MTDQEFTDTLKRIADDECPRHGAFGPRGYLEASRRRHMADGADGLRHGEVLFQDTVLGSFCHQFFSESEVLKGSAERERL